jgi:hypothetical protein
MRRHTLDFFRVVYSTLHCLTPNSHEDAKGEANYSGDSYDHSPPGADSLVRHGRRIHQAHIAYLAD